MEYYSLWNNRYSTYWNFLFEISIDVSLNYTIMVGIAPKNIDQSAINNHQKQGYYFYCFDGHLYAPNEGKQATPYSEKAQTSNKIKTTKNYILIKQSLQTPSQE